MTGKGEMRKQCQINRKGQARAEIVVTNRGDECEANIGRDKKEDSATIERKTKAFGEELERLQQKGIKAIE